MSKAHPPELKKLMDKRLTLKLNANRQVTGILRGFDPFMNVVVDDTIDTTPGNVTGSFYTGHLDLFLILLEFVALDYNCDTLIRCLIRIFVITALGGRP